MTYWESKAPEDDFGIEAGTPEVSERLEVRTRANDISPVVSPGLAGVATISLASPPRESGACRCGACLVLPDNIDWID
jgi:hypothetical protein